MNPQSRKYHVIIVHHSSTRTTNNALLSLLKYKNQPEIIIVINNSRHTYTPIVNSEAISTIQTHRNTGYAGGINTGLGALATGQAKEDDIIICMNNDITATPSTLTNLRQWWKQHPADAIVGVTIKEHKKSTTSAGHINLISGRTALQTTNYNLHPTTYQLPYIHGAFFSAPYRVFLRLKGLPEKYFLYWEDSLFCAKAIKQNIPLAVAPRVEVVHHTSRKTNSNQTYYLVRNGALFMETETPAPWCHFWWAANRTRLLYHTLNPSSKPIVRQALQDAIKGNTGQRISISNF